jgi:hypothetical protein
MKRGKKNERRKKGKIIIVWENGGTHQGQDGNFPRRRAKGEDEGKKRKIGGEERAGGRRENFLAYKRKGAVRRGAGLYLYCEAWGRATGFRLNYGSATARVFRRLGPQGRVRGCGEAARVGG